MEKRVPSTDTPTSLEVLQLTDAHLGAEPGTRLLDLDTDRSLRMVIEQARQERPRPALLLATGDLSDQGSAASYQRFAGYTENLAEHVIWLPGNHDERAAMGATLPPGATLCGHRTLGGWLVVGLDSLVEGEVGGDLAAAELARLEALLQAHSGIPTLICLHHQVLPVGCAWLDRQRVANAHALLAVVAAHPQVKALLSGHVHQDTEQDFGGVRVLTSPSTCVQFAPGSSEFRVDSSPPGYRWLRLHSDGGLETGVARVDDAAFDVDLYASGY